MAVYPEQKVASIQEHILGMYKERFGQDAKNRFASEIDVLKQQRHCTTQQAIKMMCDGGRFLVSTDSMAEFLKIVGIIDGKKRSAAKIMELYKDAVANAGSKLYSSIKQESKNSPVASVQSPKTSYNKDIIRAVQDHILNEFGDDEYDDDLTPEERFVDQINSMIGGQIRTPQDALKQWVDGAAPEIYNEDKARFLKSIGVDDGKHHEAYESAQLYDSIMLRDGMKLYNQIVSGKRKPRKPSASSESLKGSLASAGGKVKSGLSRMGTGKKANGTAVPDAMATGIQAIYYDPAESERFGRDVFDVVISLKGLKKKMWVKDYDPNTGTYKRAYPDQSSADIKTHAKGHVKVRTFVAPSRIPGRFRGSKGVN